jgi:hypothetical protein
MCTHRCAKLPSLLLLLLLLLLVTAALASAAPNLCLYPVLLITLI